MLRSRAAVCVIAAFAALAAIALPVRAADAPRGPGAGKPGAAGTVSGIVTDEAGRPLAGAVAQVFREGVKDPIRATSDSKGFYAIRGLVPGRVTVVVRAKGRIAVTQQVVVPATGLAIADACLAPGVRFAGKVVDLKDAPVADVRILAFQARNDRGGFGAFLALTAGDTTRSQADGSFEMDGIAPGREYSLRFVHPRYQTTELPGLDATAGGGHDSLRTILEDAAWVTGTVVGSDGKPIVGAAVSDGADDPFSIVSESGWMRLVMSLIDEDATPPTDAKGRFRVGSLAEPTVKLHVRAPGHFAKEMDIEGLEMGKEKAGVVVTLETATAVVEGTVVDDLGKPVAGAAVSAWSDGDQVSSAVADGGGKFRLLRVASREPVDLSASAPGHAWGSAKSVALGAKDAKVELSRLGRLALKVLGPDGKPLSRVLVRTLVEGKGRRGDADWLTQGATPLAIDLPVGHVEVVVEAEGCASKSVATYEVEPGQCFEGGTVTLEKAAAKPAPEEGGEGDEDD